MLRLLTVILGTLKVLYTHNSKIHLGFDCFKKSFYIE